MKPLGVVTPTSEQLTVVEDGSPGFWLIRGAARSGKTTTALYRLKFLVRLWRERAPTPTRRRAGRSASSTR